MRAATIDDLAPLVALENATFAVDRLSERQLRRHLDSASARLLVAVHEHRVVGSAVLFFRRGSTVARLYSIAVSAHERGLGLGAILLEAAERCARTRGKRRLRLEVRLDNVSAQRFYETAGYRRFGVRDGYYEDGHAAWRYEKTLD